jgi:hypothetical protein
VNEESEDSEVKRGMSADNHPWMRIRQVQVCVCVRVYVCVCVCVRVCVCDAPVLWLIQKEKQPLELFKQPRLKRYENKR